MSIAELNKVAKQGDRIMSITQLTKTPTTNRINATRKGAFIDISILGIVLWGVFFSLRLAGVGNIGLWTILASLGAATALIAVRKESWRDYGLRAGGNARFVISKAGQVIILISMTAFAVIAVATALGYPPTESVVLTQQPVTLAPFLLDLVFGVWIGAAIGEELILRGFLLSKFTTLFGGGRRALVLAVLAQAVWFGAGHVSQGVSGMIMAGAIGAVLGAFFLTRARRSLIPLIIAHGLINTCLLTINYFS